MNIRSFLNARRLRDYPRLMLVTTLVILGGNLLLHQGWIGGLGQVIGGDFIMFYSTGLIYKTDPARIYDYEEQFRIQQTLVEPTILSGLNPFMNPPYVAILFTVFSLFPLFWSLIIWTCLTVIFCVMSARLIAPLMPKILREVGFTDKQYLIVILSFFPFIEGILAGQNHGLTLLLVTGILVAAYRKRWLLAGALAGALIYKPHLILGLLITWLVWKNIKALAGFAGIAAIWIGSFLLVNGLSPMFSYFQISQFLLSLPYTEGFPGYIIVTLNGFLSSILPANTAHSVLLVSQILFLFAAGLVAWMAYHHRKSSPAQQMSVLALAIVFPLAFSPYVQLHDLLFTAPIFIIWACYDNTSRVFNTAVFTYVGTFILTLLAAITGIAWIAFITLGLFWQIFLWNRSI
jgi:hypothetical protein